MSTDRAWVKWGDVDPYFGVLSSDKFRSGSIDENRGEFFSSGREYIESLMKVVSERYKNIEMNRALDFGSGVGRLSIPLTSFYKEVVGVDISPGMRK